MRNLRHMIQGLLRWSRITRVGDDTADFPVQQVGYLRKVGDSVMWFPYGMHANIPIDELCLMVSMQGNPEARVSIPGSPQKRVKPLIAGEVVFFHPNTGSKLHFKVTGDIEIENGISGSKVCIKTNGDIDIDSNADVNISVVGKLQANVIGNAEINAVNVKVNALGTLDVDSVGAMSLTAPTILMTGAVTVVGKFVSTGDADLGIGGDVGLGAIHGTGFAVAAITSTTGGSVPETDSVDTGSAKVTVVGPIS